MSRFTLTQLTTIGIQDYIFSSNRLQENIGASEIVYRATTLWAFDVLEGKDGNQTRKFRHNIIRPHALDWDYDPDFQIENVNDDSAVEVITAAGGTALLIFRAHEKAIEFAKEISLKVLQTAPGLTLLVKHLPFDWESDPLADLQDANGKRTNGIRTTLYQSMDAHIQSYQASAPTLGLGVTAACDSTGLPAVRVAKGTQHLGKREFELLIGDQKNQLAEINRLISRGTAFKIAARDLAKDHLLHIVGANVVNRHGTWYEFPADIDNLGRIPGEESYVAIIHADGNRIGEHTRQATINQKDNREYIKASRIFSASFQSANQNAFREVLEKVMGAIEIDPRDGKRYVSGKVPLVKRNGDWFIPFRPLVFGGDDVTFLCNGQLGVELAVLYLDAFEIFASQNGLDLHACAGVSIVKMHYPFSRAYKLAEELTYSAKVMVKETGRDFSALDWHFAQSGLNGSLKVIRKSEFLSDQGQPLTIRPVSLHREKEPKICSWEEVRSVLEAFNQKPWSESHNKVLGLREPLRKDGDAVRQYRINFGLEKLPVFAEAAETGWFTDRCAYFDVIELLDHHVGLEPVKENA